MLGELDEEDRQLLLAHALKKRLNSAEEKKACACTSWPFCMFCPAVLEQGGGSILECLWLHLLRCVSNMQLLPLAHM